MSSSAAETTPALLVNVNFSNISLQNSALCINYSSSEVLNWRFFISFQRSSTINGWFWKCALLFAGSLRRFTLASINLKTSIQTLHSFVCSNPSLFYCVGCSIIPKHFYFSYKATKPNRSGTRIPVVCPAKYVHQILNMLCLVAL